MKLLNVLGFDMNIKERIEQLETELAGLKDYSKKQWHPKGGEWVASTMGVYSQDDNEQYLKKSGSSFETEEQAHEAFKDFRRYRRLYHLALELNEGWEPDWDNVNQAKYSITTNEKGRYFIATEHRFFWMTNVAFKSFAVAEEALRLIKDCHALEDV